MKVLHIIKSLGRGGAETLLPATISHHRKDFTFEVVYFLPWKNQLVPELNNLGVKVHCLPARSVPAMLMKLPALISLIRKGKFDIVHCHLPWAGIIGRIAARYAGVKMVYTEHNTIYRYHFFTRWIHLLTFNLQNFVVTVSNDAEKSLRDNVTMKIPVRTVLNGVDTDKFAPSAQRKELIVGTVAVFRKQKRLDVWLNIARKIADQVPAARFMVIGDGPLNAEIRKQCADLGLTNHVTFTGLVEDPRSLLAQVRVYLMSSDFEGLPIALLEAMSMQCVPVVTAVGGIPKVVEEGKSGYFYKQNETDHAAQIVRGLLDDNDRSVRMGVQARERVIDSFSIKRMTNELEQVYSEVLNGK